ncbi:MAG TPA: phage portal protein [Syntrophorhabdaceae bacterium]|nr:phage portal protein [Syntrophorhabdaceae bacterium]
MGIISRLKRPQAMNSHQLQKLIIDTYGGGMTSSGISVSSDTALRLATVQKCVRVRAATMASLPCHIMTKQGEMKEKAEDFYLYDKLLNQPNSWMTSALFWSMVEAYVCLRGNFLAYKSGLPGRPIKELIPINWDKIEKVEQNEDYSVTYTIRLKNGELKTLSQDQVMHIRGLLTLDGYTGVNPIQYFRETIGLGLASERFLTKYFGRGLQPGAIVKHPLSLSAQGNANLKAVVKEKYEQLKTDQNFMLLDEGMDITFPTIKLVDAQYLEIMKMNESDICGLFRVPLMLIQSGDKTPTYASAEQFMINYSTMGVSPDCRNYEQSIRKDLLSEEEKKKYYAKFEMRGLLRGAFKDQMEGFAVAIDKEIMNPNECRDVLDMNPYKGGDVYKTRTSTTKQQGQGVQE